MNIKTYYLRTPRGVYVCANAQAAIALAARVGRRAAQVYGSQAGADCFVVTTEGDDFRFRGVVMGRRIVGPQFGCGPTVIACVRQAIAHGTTRRKE